MPLTDSLGVGDFLYCQIAPTVSMDEQHSADPAGPEKDKFGMSEGDLIKIYGIKPDQKPGVEVLEINYNLIPEMGKKEPTPMGSFGPFPLRTHTDKIMYGCGCSYLFGLTAGGLYGAGLSLKHFPNNSLKVWHAMLLNHTTRYGPKVGNASGVLCKCDFMASG